MRCFYNNVALTAYMMRVELTARNTENARAVLVRDEAASAHASVCMPAPARAVPAIPGVGLVPVRRETLWVGRMSCFDFCVTF